MKIVLQRVSRASVAVGGKTMGSIGRGYVALLGFGERDGDGPSGEGGRDGHSLNGEGERDGGGPSGEGEREGLCPSGDGRDVSLSDGAKAKIEKMVAKIQKLRIFPDENGKTNLSINDVGGGLLVISQFTLFADCRKGNRPSFIGAAHPSLAESLYDYFVDCAKGKFSEVAHGVFGAYMQVDLVNDGPFTVILEDG